MKTFEDLWAQSQRISRERPEGSGTVRLLDAGVHAIGKKVLEEAGEVWIAAEYQNDQELAQEISQLLYQVQTLMISRNISLDDVYTYL